MPLTLLNEKNRNRISVILLHAFSQFLPSIGNLILSVIVIRLFVPQWWGQIAALQLYQYLSVQVVAWGNKDVLLKSFSRQPGELSQAFVFSFANRIWLLPAVVFVICLTQDSSLTGMHLCIWIMCRFIQQSVDAPSLFLRKFKAVIFSEILSVAVMASGLFVLTGTSFNTILLVISVGQLLKTFIQVIAFSAFFKGFHLILPNRTFFASSFPFMLLGLLAILQQKTDLLFVVRFTDDLSVARYQVFTTFYLLALSIPMLIAGPFIKNVYRISAITLSNLQFIYALSGVIINLLIMIAGYLILEHIYQFHFETIMYVLAWMSASITYLFSLKIIRFFKSDRQLWVLGISFSSVLVNAIASAILLPVWGITGALTANALSQLFLLVLFLLTSRKFETERQ